jgi:murein DD-endopeptidase MepM/ murein hydrolase activator NlpD
VKSWLLGIALLLGSLPAPAELPRTEPVPGGIVTVRLGPVRQPAPQVFLAEARVMVLAHEGAWHAVVGLPLTLEPGEHHLRVIVGDSVREFPFEVTAKEYRVQHITLPDQRMVEPPPEDLARIEQDYLAINGVFERWSEIEAPSLRFDLPAKGRISGNFGLRRYFNEQPRQPHSGIDIAAPVGTPVLAPAPGVVIEVGEYFFNGRTVFIDHGQGLVSMYTHLHRALVAPGTPVKRGQRIGEIGKSGRATGPHLHWTVSLNNARVDPLLLISKKAVKQMARQ